MNFSEIFFQKFEQAIQLYLNSTTYNKAWVLPKSWLSTWASTWIKEKKNLFLEHGLGPTPESIQVHDLGLRMENKSPKYLA